MKTYRVYHKNDPTRYVDLKAPAYWPMEIRKRAIGDFSIFTWAEYTSLRIKRLEPSA